MSHSLYTMIPKDPNASNYYRQQLPLDMMIKLGLPLRQAIDRLEATVSMGDRFGVMSNADILLHYHLVSEGYISFLEKLRSVPALRSANTGEFRWPPMMIVDTDDDVFSVDPTNLTYAEFGVENNGEMLEDGAVVTQTDLATGEEWLLWDDRAEVGGVPNRARNINLADNRHRVDLWRRSLKLGQLVTCTTPRCEAYVKREVPDANTYIFPNSIDFSAYRNIELREHPGEVRVLWQGGDSHFPDLLTVKDAMVEVAQKYPFVKWMIFGQKFQWMEDALGPNVEYVPWVPYPAYKATLGTLGHDINLCPLKDTKFNHAKSAIKFYESSVISRPAATLAANVGNYADELIDGETALLYNTKEEFITKLCGLIEDAKLRKTLASNARDWVKTHRDAEKTVPKLYAKWMETLSNYHITHPKDPSRKALEALPGERTPRLLDATGVEIQSPSEEVSDAAVSEQLEDSQPSAN